MELLPVTSKSGNIVKAGYENGIAQVQFKSGALYEYECPEELGLKFKATFDSSDSTGEFFHQFIKNLPTKRIK